MSDESVWQDGPEAALDEFGEFISEEFGMFVGGRVAPSFDAGVKLFAS